MNTRGMILLKNNGRSQTNAQQAVHWKATRVKLPRCRKLIDLELAVEIPDFMQRIYKQVPFQLSPFPVTPESDGT